MPFTPITPLAALIITLVFSFTAYPNERANERANEKVNERANDSTSNKQLIAQCQQQLEQSDKKLHQLASCESLIASENAENLFIFGHLLRNTAHKHNQSFRKKRGLFYWVLAADQNNISAIKGLSNFVKSKMVDNKIPIKYGHYLSYLEADWALNQQDPKHHYAIYQQWLDTVEQSIQNPQQQSTKTLIDIATALENGYYLGRNPKNALKLYRIAAERNDKTALYKAGELLLEKDQRTALMYLYKAAEFRSGDAMLKLGDFFGCSNNKDQAEKWYRQAIQVGNEYAEEELESLKNSGKPSQC